MGSALCSQSRADLTSSARIRRYYRTRRRSLPFVALRPRESRVGTVERSCATAEVRTMNCEQYQELLSDLVDGFASGEDRNRIESHLSGCVACAEVRDDFVAIVGYCHEH